MPYRRLPNTDSARIRALKAALVKGENLHPFDLAYSQVNYVKLKSILNAFQNAVVFQRQTTKFQSKNNKDLQEKMHKVQMYLSHFVQVLNFSIIRGELPEKIRPMYGLSVSEKKVPALYSEEEIVANGAKIIDGEDKRTRVGGKPLLNPKISIVKIHYDHFLDAYHRQKILKENTARAQMQVASLRAKADDLIVLIWNEIENHFEDNPSDKKRAFAIDYGVVYVYRKNERLKSNNLQMSA